MNDVNKNAKAPWWGALIGFCLAAVLAYNLILPADVRSLHLSDVKFGDWILVFVAFVVCLACAAMGYIIGETAGDSE